MITSLSGLAPETRRRSCVCFRTPSRKSVCNVRSCASSIITTPYRSRFASAVASRRSMPSVRNFTRVAALETSSKRIAYPTRSPSAVPVSSATRRATETAATRRGCVHATASPPARPASCAYCGSCVVFPEPVSPTTISVSRARISATSRSRENAMGNEARTRWSTSFRARRAAAASAASAASAFFSASGPTFSS